MYKYSLLSDREYHLNFVTLTPTCERATQVFIAFALKILTKYFIYIALAVNKILDSTKVKLHTTK